MLLFSNEDHNRTGNQTPITVLKLCKMKVQHQLQYHLDLGVREKITSYIKIIENLLKISITTRNSERKKILFDINTLKYSSLHKPDLQLTWLFPDPFHTSTFVPFAYYCTINK